MSAVLLDTQVFAWGLDSSRLLKQATAERIKEADTVYVSSVSFYEIGQKVRIGKWREMAVFLDRLQLLAEAGGGKVAAVEGHIAIRAALLPWQHRDPFDRLIAATAIALKTPLVSSDTAFDMLSGEADWLGRIW